MASGRSSRCRWPRRQAGTSPRWSAQRALRLPKRLRPGCTGRSRPWSTSRVTHAGGGSSKVPVKIPTSPRRHAARVHGFQGKDLRDPLTIMATAKHFVAYGAAEAGRDYNTADVSERTLREIICHPSKRPSRPALDR